MNKITKNESVLRTLRALVPTRRLTFSESLRLAELQANRLLELFQLDGPAVPSEIVSELPRIEVRLDPDLPVSGSAHWETGRWIITLNATEPLTRQRFSLLHEFKHVLDHTTKDSLYGDGPAAASLAERAADQFAACVLMPKRWLKSRWFGSGQRLVPVAAEFEVSTRALSVRLWRLGIGPDTARCAEASATERFTGKYFRSSALQEAAA